MAVRVYFDADADLARLAGKAIAICGYGAQGRSHALNLRDSGCRVVVAQRPGGKGYRAAVDDGFTPISLSEAARSADVLNLLLPDERHGPLFRDELAPHLRPGQILMTCHGYSLHYRHVVPPPGVPAILVAPKAAGHRVRSAFTEGRGVPCLIAPGPGADADTMAVGLAYAKALGGTRAGVLETTVAAETETDLFGEQAVLCGGMSHLVQAAFQTLVDAGYPEELAYFECVHELKLVVDLVYQGGLAFMHDHISNTAEFGDVTRGPRIVDDHVRQTMREILEEIRSGRFAAEWQHECDADFPQLRTSRQREAQSRIEEVGRRLRQQMGLEARD